MYPPTSEAQQVEPFPDDEHDEPSRQVIADTAAKNAASAISTRMCVSDETMLGAKLILILLPCAFAHDEHTGHECIHETLWQDVESEVSSSTLDVSRKTLTSDGRRLSSSAMPIRILVDDSALDSDMNSNGESESP